MRDLYFIYLFIYLFYFICHTNYKKYRKRRRKKKKKWRGDLRETIGAYERLGLLELWARAISHQLKRRRRKVEDGKIYKLFSYLLNNLIFSFFLKEERDWELMILLSRTYNKNTYNKNNEKRWSHSHYFCWFLQSVWHRWLCRGSKETMCHWIYPLFI